MNSQLALDFGPAPTTGITHVCLPNFSLACGVDYLDKPAGDRVTFGWHTDKPPSCRWCHSLGRAYCRHAAAEMQQRQAA